MALLVGVLAWFFPRLTIILLVVFTDYIGAAFPTFVWPLLGFFFAPLTTLAYAFAINHAGGVGGWHAALLAVAVLADLGLLRGAHRAARTTSRR